MVARSAGRNRAIVRTHKAVAHRYITGSNVGNHFGDKERAETRHQSAIHEAFDLLVERFNTADSRRPDNPCHLFVDLFEVEPRVLNSLFGRNEGVLCKEVVFADILAVEMLACVVIFYLARKLCFEQRCIEMSYRPGTTYSVL